MVGAGEEAVGTAVTDLCFNNFPTDDSTTYHRRKFLVMSNLKNYDKMFLYHFSVFGHAFFVL